MPVYLVRRVVEKTVYVEAPSNRAAESIAEYLDENTWDEQLQDSTVTAISEPERAALKEMAYDLDDLDLDYAAQVLDLHGGSDWSAYEAPALVEEADLDVCDEDEIPTARCIGCNGVRLPSDLDEEGWCRDCLEFQANEAADEEARERLRWQEGETDERGHER